MATHILMPQLGESITEGTIGLWLKHEGDRVEQYEALLEILTDKVNIEYPSPVTGVITKIFAKEGDTLPVGAELAIIEEMGVPGGEQVAARATDGGEAKEAAAPAAPSVTAPPPVTGATERSAVTVPDEVREHLSPAVRKLADEHKLSAADLASIQGTGAGGRITKEDVFAFVAGRVPAAPPTVAGAVAPAKAVPGDDEVVPLTPMRKTIAERLVLSKNTAPHAWTMIEVDMTRLVAWRQQLKEEFRRREGVDLTYLPFVIKAVVQSLKDVPMLNASWAGDRIIIHKRIHIGIAVGLEEGLVVPVIRDADQKSIAALAKAVSELAHRAKAGKLTLDELQGGTFTVNNTGAFGSVLSAPILNPPEAGILSMEAIIKRPVVIDDAIAIRSMMNVCLSLDHRVVDGVLAGRFLQGVRKRLEGFGSETPLY